MLFYGKIFSNDANRLPYNSWVTTFTDFLEVFLNKFFTFTRDIARASPIINLGYVKFRFGRYIGVG